MKKRSIAYLLSFAVIIIINTNIYLHAEPSNYSDRLIDLRLSVGAGAFYYPQIVDGGYYINGYPYDLTWYGTQLQLSGDLQFFVKQVPGLSAGVGGAYFSAINPKGMSSDYSVTVSARGNGIGGYGGISGSYWLDNSIRLNFLAGYGGTGVEENYGGYGFTMAIGATLLFPGDQFIGGVGVKFLYMNLYSPADADTRSERGSYMAMLIEASVDWTR